MEVEQVVVERAQKQPSGGDAGSETDRDGEQDRSEIFRGHCGRESANRYSGGAEGGEFACSFGQIDGHRDVDDGEGK